MTTTASKKRRGPAATAARTAAPRRKVARKKAAAPIVVSPDAALAAGRSLWLAGLGLAVAAVEGATGVFETLVAKGRVQQPEARAAAERMLVAARRQAAELGELAADAARKGKRQLDGTLEGAMDRLGVDRRPRSKNLLHRLGDLADAML